MIDNADDSSCDITILLIENDDAQRSAVIRHLDAGEVIVLHASSLESARGLPRRTECVAALVSSDVLRPDVPARLRRVRELVGNSAVPIIVMGGANDSDTVFAALRAGANDHLAKPVRRSALQMRISALRERAVRDLPGEETARLEAAVAERTAALRHANQILVAEIAQRRQAEAALRDAKFVAESANEAKNRFLATMSHELRTPLNAIIGFSEMMEAEIWGPIGAPEYREYLGDVLTGGRHLLSIINDILDTVRIDSDQMPMREVPTRIADVLRDCHRSFMVEAQEAEIALSLECDYDPLEIWVDSRLIKQAMINLLSNALKFTRPGGAISTVCQVRESGLFLSVRDSGIGIAKDKIAVALEPFGQIDGGYTRKQGGVGLGLPLVKRIAELHGGGLTLVSEPQLGTDVTIALPASRILVWPDGVRNMATV